MIKTAIFLNDFCYINGGGSRVAIDTAEALANAGVEVKFLGAVGPVCDQLKNSRVDVTCLNQPELINFATRPSVAIQGLWNAPAARATRQILAACDPEHTVVHIHGWTKALTSSAIREVTKAKFSSVLTLHDFFSACPNGAFYDYQAGQCCHLRALSAQCIVTHCDKRSYAHKMFRVLRGAVQRTPGDFPGGVRNHIALSRGSERLMRPYLPQGARVFQLENMIGLDRADPVDAGRNRRIVAVGRLDQEKGVELLIEAARLAGVDVTFVGDGQLRPLVERHAHCEVTGWKSSAEVFQALRSARALVFPSLWYETYGLVVSEAIALGVPAIVSDVSAAAERVAHGATGWVFESGNAAALADCLRALGDDEAVGRIGRQAYENFWADAPTKARHIRQLLAIYETILGERDTLLRAA